MLVARLPVATRTAITTTITITVSPTIKMALSSIGNAMQSSRLTLRNSDLKKVLKVQNLDAGNLFYVLSSFAGRMAKSSFEVGEKEKHTLTVDRDWVMKRILIELDGEKLADEYHYSPLAKTFSFDVGSSEVHKVEVSLGRFSYFKGREVKVLVDGKPARGSSS